jgi:cytochrome bd-type quinol oxidase subunit 2
MVPVKLLIGLPPEAAQYPLTVGSMLWPMSAMYVVLCVSAAAGLSCVYLVVRRNRDDFGRDYYRFSLNLASRWALISMLLFLACQGWLFAVLPDMFRTMTTQTPLGMIWAAGCVLGLACVGLWSATAKSDTPLRFKGLTVVAACLLWLMHAMNVTVFINFMSML